MLGKLHHRQLCVLRARIHLFESYKFLVDNADREDPTDVGHHEQALSEIRQADAWLIQCCHQIERKIAEEVIARTDDPKMASELIDRYAAIGKEPDKMHAAT